jgi:hypothetical protein
MAIQAITQPQTVATSVLRIREGDLVDLESCRSTEPAQSCAELLFSASSRPVALMPKHQPEPSSTTDCNARAWRRMLIAAFKSRSMSHPQAQVMRLARSGMS